MQLKKVSPYCLYSPPILPYFTPKTGQFTPNPFTSVSASAKWDVSPTAPEQKSKETLPSPFPIYKVYAVSPTWPRKKTTRWVCNASKRPFAVFFASILCQNPDKNQRHSKMGLIQAHSEQDNSKQKVVRYGFSKYSWLDFLSAFPRPHYLLILPILDQPEMPSNLKPSGRAPCAFPFRFAPSNAHIALHSRLCSLLHPHSDEDDNKKTEFSLKKENSGKNKSTGL